MIVEVTMSNFLSDLFQGQQLKKTWALLPCYYLLFLHSIFLCFASIFIF